MGNDVAVVAVGDDMGLCASVSRRSCGGGSGGGLCGSAGSVRSTSANNLTDLQETAVDTRVIAFENWLLETGSGSNNVAGITRNDGMSARANKGRTTGRRGTGSGSGSGASALGGSSGDCTGSSAHNLANLQETTVDTRVHGFKSRLLKTGSRSDIIAGIARYDFMGICASSGRAGRAVGS